MQQTIKEIIEIDGIGLHSGVSVKLTIKPASIGAGIIFKRIDLKDKPEFKAIYSNVVDTKNSTNLGKDGKIYVRTIEHVMSALYITGIDNAVIEVDNEEMPIMDGSAKIFLDEIEKSGIKVQNKKRKLLKIKKEISFTDDKGNTISIKPALEDLMITFEIDFPSKIVGHQVFSGKISKDVFAKSIAPCRTFCEKYQVDYLKSIGLIKGGSLENAVVLDGEKILNPEGLRVENECVNHKVLDVIGDMYTSGYHIIGEINASKTGHFHSNELLKKLFSNSDNYEIV